jgi:hypothetical protein
MTERPLRYVKTGARTKDSNPHLRPYTDLHPIDHPTHKSAPKTVRFFKLQTIDFLHQREVCRLNLPLWYYCLAVSVWQLRMKAIQ